MKQRTNISVPYTLKDNSDWKYMRFICEYVNDSSYVKVDNLYNIDISADGSINPFYQEDIKYIGYKDSFINKVDPRKYISFNCTSYNENIDDGHRFINIYFPTESISTYYRRATKFYIGIYTYINIRDPKNPPKTKSIRLYLYSNIIDSYDNLACTPFIENDVRYQEYQKIRIIDIEKYINNNDLSLGESAEMNEYLIHVNIQPIVANGDLFYSFDNTYTGSSFIQYIDKSTIRVQNILDYENHIITSNISKDNLQKYINGIYKNTTPDINMRYILFNKNNEMIYVDKKVHVNDLDNISVDIKDLIDKLLSSENIDRIRTGGWSLWEEGLQITSTLEITAEETEIDFDKEYISNTLVVRSQPISINYELFKFIVDKPSIPDVDLNEINDLLMNINVVNKIEQNNIKISQSGTSNEGIIKPVFYKTYDLDDIILHKNIYENIMLNLDDYKNIVDVFNLKIGNTFFTETARTVDGILFRVNGAIASPQGTYYICDGDGTFITSGKYTCI